MMGLRKGQTNSGSFKKGEHRSKNTEFKKGKRKSIKTEFGNKPPWNKGLKGKDYKKHYNNGFKGLIQKGCSPWNKGIYKIGKALRSIIRDCHKMVAWRDNCFMLDDYTCQDCEVKGGKLVVHHIKHFETIMRENNIQNIREAFNCEELWNLDNGITLCVKCHRIRHKEEGYRR